MGMEKRIKKRDKKKGRGVKIEKKSEKEGK